VVHSHQLWSAIGLVSVFHPAHDWMHRFHSIWFHLSVEQFDAIHYAGMTVFKLGIILFNLVPYIALRIVG